MPKDQLAQHDDFVARAQARVRELHRQATELTAELGLPLEAKGTLLAGLYDRSTMPVSTAEIGHSDKEQRGQLFRLVEGFLREQIPGQLGRFEALRDVLELLPAETISNRLGGRQPLFAGLSFGSDAGTLGAVISTTSWVLSQQENTTGTVSPLSVERIAAVAQARGCSRGMSFALASYLYSQLIEP